MSQITDSDKCSANNGLIDEANVSVIENVEKRSYPHP